MLKFTFKFDFFLSMYSNQYIYVLNPANIIPTPWQTMLNSDSDNVFISVYCKKNLFFLYLDHFHKFIQVVSIFDFKEVKRCPKNRLLDLKWVFLWGKRNNNKPNYVVFASEKRPLFYFVFPAAKSLFRDLQIFWNKAGWYFKSQNLGIKQKNILADLKVKCGCKKISVPPTPHWLWGSKSSEILGKEQGKKESLLERKQIGCLLLWV